MTGDREQKIRERAHAIWQDEGQPHGRHDDHWDQASREFDAQPVESSVEPTEAPEKPKAARAAKSAPDTDAPKRPRAARGKKSAD